MKDFIKSNLLGLGILTGLSLYLIFIANKYILSVKFYNNNGIIFSVIPGNEGNLYHDIQKWIYLVAAAYLLIKVGVIALVIFTALYLTDVVVTYEKILKVVIFSEYIFLIPALLKIVWFLRFYPDGTITDWHKLYILSLLSIAGKVSSDWYYPLQTLNLFEVAYWFLLAFGLTRVTKLDFECALRIVIVSYLPALLIWVSAVAYYTVVMFPNYA